jgi:hypothetical protein
MGTVQGGNAGSRALGIAAYAVIFALGVSQGLVGSFQYSQSPVPLVAIGLDVAILATCLLAAWGMRTFGGMMAAGGGWLIMTFILAMGTHAGSVIITNTAAGEWYLYGGTLSVLVSAPATFFLLPRSRLGPGPG